LRALVVSARARSFSPLFTYIHTESIHWHAERRTGLPFLGCLLLLAARRLLFLRWLETRDQRLVAILLPAACHKEFPMTIHLIAAYVPDGSLVRCDAQGERIEGRFHCPGLLIAGERHLCLTPTTLLCIVRFPQEEPSTPPPLDRLLADPVPLTDWLRAQPAARTVGRAGLAASCPLARFLRAQGYTAVWVTQERSSANGPQGRVHTPHPRWVVDFLTAVDDRPRGVSLTASETLTLLERVSKGGCA
jgi:hypothetical protein